MNAEHPKIIASLRRTRRGFLVAAAITIPTALFMLAAPAWSNEGRNVTIAATAIGAVFLAFGAGLVWMLSRYWRPLRSPVMEILRDRPDEIVWIYSERLDHRAHGPGIAPDPWQETRIWQT